MNNSFIGTSSTFAICVSILSDTPTRSLATEFVYCGFLPILRANSRLVMPFSLSISSILSIIGANVRRKMKINIKY